ncbi:Cof-type HAD-IIB family hydrolase [Fredinandcohnia sp. 179-A 10B2 NHS]|uniref:Cof-type HAD-IIB family hydrolase n=1 Tax=Fredinandcohnia sp. 179-A 10B2 NHS TaxID=3235176 RepID=UPI0039A349F4
MIKCIATDMDGTLLNSDHVISQETREAILQAQQQGIMVVAATGRSYDEAKYVLVDAGIQCPIICANGGEIRSENGEILLSNPINISKAGEVMKVLKENEMYFELYTSTGTYSDDYDKAITIIMDIFMSHSLKSNYEKSLEAAKERFESGLIHLVDNFESVLEKEGNGANKFIAFSFNKEKLERVKKQLAAIEDIAVSSSGKENIEVNSIYAQKGNALAAFTAKHGISLEETMAIGDNYNDVSMFKKAGLAVAMGNAPDDIKELCHKVTDTNENHGVAKAILNVLK